ncbi:hypothetical protein F4809DRAFT_529759 [Biscogniauxia mediterranea]|nr:hypothetical protein F4809DRAFT_529759 [Biscogniauxia mediterranea]
MRSLRTPPTLLLTLLLTTLTAASPYPRDNLRDVGFGYLMPSGCAEYCGANNEHCCADGQTCLTAAGTPTCTGADALGPRDWSDYTTTWTETRTYTSTISSWNGVPTTATGGTGSNGEDCVPPEGSGQIACGPICCANWQYCESRGQCALNPTAGTWTEWTTVGIVTTQFSAPYRVTSGSTIIVTATPTTTGTAGSITATTSSTVAPVAESTSGQLSGGAIAGIVIGTIAGVILLLLLCFCCIARGLWHGFAGLFGGKKRDRKTERIEVIEERYSRRGGSQYGTGARPVHRTWFGGGGGRPSTAATRKEKRSSTGGGGLGWLGAGAAAAAVLLGLRRSDKRKQEQRRTHKGPRGGSEWSSSYYTDSYTASSPSSLSSDRRTRDTRRSGRSRQSRRSRNSRPSRTSRSRPSRI